MSVYVSVNVADVRPHTVCLCVSYVCMRASVCVCVCVCVCFSLSLSAPVSSFSLSPAPLWLLCLLCGSGLCMKMFPSLVVTGQRRQLHKHTEQASEASQSFG